MVAVLRQECGVSSVETMVDRLRSWSVEALNTHFVTRVVLQGRLFIDKDGLAVHMKESIYLRHLPLLRWALFEIKSKTRGSTQAKTMYATYNVGNEGWCTLVSNLHTMLHVLKNQDVPFGSLIPDWANCSTRCMTSDFSFQPRIRPRKCPFRSQNAIITFYPYSRELSPMLKARDGSLSVLHDYLHLYVTDHDGESGCFLLSGFDF